MTMNAHRSLRALSMAGLTGVAGLLLSSTARADRVYVVEETREPDYYYYEPHSSLDLAFDGEAAVPLMDRRFQSGNDLTGGGGFKFRVGDQIPLPAPPVHARGRLRVRPSLRDRQRHVFVCV